MINHTIVLAVSENKRKLVCCNFTVAEIKIGIGSGTDTEPSSKTSFTVGISAISASTNSDPDFKKWLFAGTNVYCNPKL